MIDSSIKTLWFLLALFFTLKSLYGQSKTNDLVKAVMPHTEIFEVEEKQVYGEKNTNGLSCVLTIANVPRRSSQVPPICDIKILNTTTNTLYWWSGLHVETYSKIELLNSNGKQPQKTLQGQLISTRLSDTKIKEMIKDRFKQWIDGRARTPGFMPIRSGQNYNADFSLSELFELKEEGDYTLKFQTCIIQKIDGKEYDPVLKTIWLPEVQVKFQLKSKNSVKQTPP